jgi:hypothetical protein
MVDEDIGLCAVCQKWLMFVLNSILFIVGVAQIGIACYILVADGEGLGFAADLFAGNDSAIQALLAFGIVLAVISCLACLAFKKENRVMLWLYAIILCFVIIGEAMAVVVVGVSVNYGDPIFEALWKKLEPETINNIEVFYKCCSFNGNSSDTWEGDKIEYEECADEPDFEPLESCWGKFKGVIDENYEMVKVVAAFFLGFQILIYFSTHYVLQSISRAEGRVEAVENLEIERLT